jgi:hypothetical protein
MNTENCYPSGVGSTSAGVVVEWDHDSEPGTVDRAQFVFTEVATGNQTKYEVVPRFRTCIGLVAGIYRVGIFAKGLEVQRSLIELRAGAVVPFKPVLKPDTAKPKTLGEILAKFEIAAKVNPRSLDVPENTTVVLDSDDHQFKGDWHTVEIKDVESAKRMIGNPDDLFPGGLPRFQSAISSQASPNAIAKQAAGEFVYGNSAAVKQWAGLINGTVFDEIWKIPVFAYDTVTINRGGVLVIGNRGNFFVCSNLRMHVTATLLIRGQGPIHVEPASFRTFC